MTLEETRGALEGGREQQSSRSIYCQVLRHVIVEIDAIITGGGPDGLSVLTREAMLERFS